MPHPLTTCRRPYPSPPLHCHIPHMPHLLLTPHPSPHLHCHTLLQTTPPHHPLQVLPNDAGLDVSREVLLVQPQDLVHLCHIQGHHHTRLLRRDQQSTRHIRPTWGWIGEGGGGGSKEIAAVNEVEEGFRGLLTSERNEADILIAGDFDYVFNIFVTSYVFGRGITTRSLLCSSLPVGKGSTGGQL